MKITVETKFDIGDVVYIADRYHEFYANRKPRVIKNIYIMSTAWRTYVQYEVEYSGTSELVFEACTFATYEECTKWCNENN